MHGWYRRVVNGRYIRWVVTHTHERTNERPRVGRRPDRRSERRVDLTMEWMNGWNGLVPRRARNTATGTGTTALRSAFFLCVVDSTRLDSTRLASPVSVGRGRTNRTEPNRTARWLSERGFGIEPNRTIERCVERTRARRRIVDDGGRFYIFIRAHGSVGDDGDGGEEPGGRERAR